MTGPSLLILPDPESLALSAAAVVVAQARRAVKRNGRFTIALSGGDTPRRAYELLAQPSLAGLLPWEATYVFWGDERCVDPSDPRSNEGMAREALLSRVPIPEGQVHPMRCAGSHGRAERRSGAPQPGDPASSEASAAAALRAAEEYEEVLRSFFDSAAEPGQPRAGVDLCLLGLGANGHTASLFPGSDVLAEQGRWAAAALEDPGTAMATSGTGERLWRVTLTAPFINRSGLVLFVVGGRAKAPVVREATQGQGSPEHLPAILIRPVAGRLVWLLDDEAGAGLRARPRRRAGCGAPSERAASAEQDDEAAEPESFDDLPECELGPSR